MNLLIGMTNHDLEVALVRVQCQVDLLIEHGRAATEREWVLVGEVVGLLDIVRVVHYNHYGSAGFQNEARVRAGKAEAVLRQLGVER